MNNDTIVVYVFFAFACIALISMMFILLITHVSPCNRIPMLCP